ncbi:hypothetical protein HID58_025569 [Brassica napus]|uniref:Uncharacterized protein n=1 Tax=Brassica napus TaxID=3708 RepID=A0ABQ8CLH1_BRANA|nr:hypothetical protein HID58_025569 [Brassica napus]
MLMQGDYEAGTKLFGTPNIIRMMKLAPREQKHLQDDYEAATKLFGTQNIIRMMKLAAHEQKHLLASSILKEGAAWIGGGYGVI